MQRDTIDHNLEDWQRRAPGLDVSGRRIIWRIQLASRYIEQAYAALADEADRLSPSSTKLLIHLATLPPPHQITPKAMGELLDLTSGSVTSLIDRLESSGYVARHPDPDDRRGVLVRLTPDGLATARRLTAAYYEFEAALLAPLDDAERETLVTLLRKLLAAHEAPDGEMQTSGA